MIAVTGASGFLGSAAVRALVAAGHPVRAVVRSPDKARHLGVEVAKADLLDPAALAEAFRGCDAVVANAALLTKSRGTWDDFVAANCTGTANQLAAAREAGERRVVYVSTIAVYRTRLNRVLGPDHERVSDAWFDWSWLVTDRYYARSKARAEELVWRSGLDVTVLRPGPIYGPGGGRLTEVYERVLGWRVAPAPLTRMTHVHVDDVAGAIAGAIANPASVGRAYNVSGPSVSAFDVLGTLKRQHGRGPVLLPVPIPVWVDYDDGDAERDLGFRARGIAEGFADAIRR